MQHHADAIAAFSEQQQAAQRAKDAEAMRRAFADRGAFMRRHGLLMRYVMLPALVQLPVFVTFFSTLRQLAREAHLPPLQGAATEPFLHLASLHLPDPTFAIPLASAALAAAAIGINRNLQGAPQLDLTAGGQRLLFGSLSVVFNLATGVLPAAVQLYIGVTSLTMLLQQAALRLAPARRLLGFPSDWPLPPEVVAERQRRREQAGNANANFMIEGMRGLQPLFRRVSRLAAGDPWPEPKHQFVSLMGLSHPGAPPPPDTPPPQMIAAQAAGAGAAASAGAEGKAAGAPAPKAAPGVVLLTHRPSKKQLQAAGSEKLR
jgi:hypothetical protein